MKNALAFTAALLIAGTVHAAHAACTPEEAQAKANAFAQAVQTKAQNDPNGYATIMQELQPQLLDLQQKQDMNALCDFYDAAMDKLK